MTTRIGEALALTFPPLAILSAPDCPVEAEEPHPLCAMTAVGRALAGKTVALSLGSCGCPGAGEGLALEPSRPEAFPGGRACYLRFLSTGNRDWEHGRRVLESLEKAGAPRTMLEEFANGEGFIKTPERVAEWLENLPDPAPAGPFVVIKPLDALREGETPLVVTLLVDAEQLSALVVLANYADPARDNVAIPFATGCASLVRLPLAEAGKTHARAIIGLTDISSRIYLRKVLGKDLLAFSIPWARFQEMEADVPGSFLERSAWSRLQGL